MVGYFTSWEFQREKPKCGGKARRWNWTLDLGCGLRVGFSEPTHERLSRSLSFAVCGNWGGRGFQEFWSGHEEKRKERSSEVSLWERGAK